MGSPHGQGFGEPIGGSNEKTVGKSPNRGLLADVAAPEAAKTTWIYSFVTNPVYGGFSVNVLADIFVRILLFLGTYFTGRLCYGRVRKRERIARDLEFQRQLHQALGRRRFLESRVDVLSQGSPGTPPVLQADNSTAQSSSAAPPSVPENHAYTMGSIPAGSIPGFPPQASSSTSAISTTGFIPGSISGSRLNSMNAVPTEPTIAAQCGQLRQRNGYTIRSKSMGHATSTSSESPPVAKPCPDDVAKDHVIDIPFLCRFPSLTTETKKENKFKETVKEKLGVTIGHDVCSSRMMQGRVPATEENLRALREVAIEGTKLDEGFTLQIGASFMYCCTGKGKSSTLSVLGKASPPRGSSLGSQNIVPGPVGRPGAVGQHAGAKVSPSHGRVALVSGATAAPTALSATLDAKLHEIASQKALQGQQTRRSSGYASANANRRASLQLATAGSSARPVAGPVGPPASSGADDCEQPVLLSLRDVEVPTILQAEYSAGLLTVRGRYLEGAEIRAATAEGYMIFESVKQDPIDHESLPEERIETWRCTDLLPPVKLDQIQIFASKRVQIEGQSVTVRSELCSIQDTTLRTVICKWVPTIIIVSILASQLWTILALLSDLVTNPLHPWLSYPTLASMMYIIQLLSPSLEENINYFIERLKLAISSFHVFPKPLATPTFFMRDGSCFQRGARYLIYPQPPTPTPTKLEGHDILERTIEEKGRHKQEKENLVTQIDWKWPCVRINEDNGRWENFDPDSNDYGLNFNDDLPFEVLYWDKNYRVQELEVDGEKRFVKNHYLPKDIVIKLYSKHLQNVVREYFPNNMKQFESYGEIQAKDLLILYVNGKWPRRTFVSWSNLPSTLDDEHQKNHLHMFHLTRFLEKEYANTIKQYERMMKARIISWDMLWTLIVPGIDVIYYCKISNQELCGKVSATSYELEKRKPGKFSVDLEVYNFDSNNFVMVNVHQGLYFFKDDVKIINLAVFPLQCKANPQESEESLFQRGKIFYDLVLKHERQFMHYEGLMYEGAYGDFMGPSYRREGGHNFKASIDGRVMIDQTWFAKLKPSWDMDAPRASGWNPINERSQTRNKAIASEFDSVLKYSPAIAHGYSFSIRKWGCFDITGFSKIHFVSTAFDKLVMKEEKKHTLVTLTEYYINNTQGINNTATHIDVLPNKGQGCIIVLHGPPGTGKTLTVESLAERLECPLWQLSTTELSASSGLLENQLLSVFEVAKSWGAILALDEADVYLSSRKYSPLSSDNTPNNAMTGVFLRVLEYYKGVLFLTTNVMSHIEPAIFSRISLFIKYEEFNTEERKRLWNNFLEESKILHLSEGFWKKVLPVEFNGRVIRNIVQSAQILIQSKYFGTETPEQCVLRAFDAMTDPSTLNYLVDAHEVHEANQSTQEVAPSIPSASTVW